MYSVREMLKKQPFVFKKALQMKDTPSALLLTRQGVPVAEKSWDEINAGVDKGGYIYQDCKKQPELVFIATGSELSLALDTAERMSDKHIRIVSLPCWELFMEQSIDYINDIIPPRAA